MSAPRFARVLLTAACLLLALPALASAETFVVDTTVDQADENPGDGNCEIEAEGCSLRAAIEEVNSEGEAFNEIEFDSSVFDGGETDNIFLSSQLEPIFVPTVIDAKATCFTAGIDGAPCAGVSGTGFDPVFVVEAGATAISGLSITNGSIGIYVAGESTGFIAVGNWIGKAMSGSNFGNGTGIFLGPGSDGALIGSPERVDRNVIAHNEIGLDIEGASDATVQGNWFGPLGSGGDPAQATKNIEITDFTAPGEEDKAEDIEIGATVEGAELASSECDGGCNVISGASEFGIDLAGDGGFEAPASGPTEIHGNYIGLDGAGTEVRANEEVGVEVGAAAGVTVGAGELDGQPGDANLITGGDVGVRGDDADNLKVIGNEIGFASTGVPLDPPAEVGILTSKPTEEDPDESTAIVGNTLRMDEEGIGIEHQDYGISIEENSVEGGEVGIQVTGTFWGGTGVVDNEIVEPEETGILVSHKNNGIWGNEVTGAGEVGIEISAATADVSGNLIGRDFNADEENRIYGSGTAAILIRGVEASRNEVARNRGSGNEGEGFIILRPYNGPEGDPNGVRSPTIATAVKTEASGEAEPNAVVRLFWKASDAEGELAGFLGKVTADASGNWKATYAAQPEGTRIVATQTLGGGTSNLSEIATTTSDTPVNPPCTVNCGGGGGNQTPPSTLPGPPAEKTKPKVTIKKAPKAKSTNTTAKFVFSSSVAGSKFKCKLDKKAWANCKSPKTYKKLKAGKHVFKVKATAAGLTSAVVTRKFTVQPPA